MDILAVNNFGDTRSGGIAGPMGAFVIALMAIATVLLIRNMNKRIRRLPDSFADVDAARRDEEIARMEADLQRPDAAPAGAPIDADPSQDASTSAESQVSGSEPTERRPSPDGGTGAA